MPIYVVHKPIGLTSHDVVARARKVLRTKAVGHAGTLDPLAAGVLILLTGADTKLSPYLTASTKKYYAWVALGSDSATFDAEGPLTGGNLAIAQALTAAEIQATFPHFLSLSEQRPPAYSAVQQGGVRSYERARRGEEVDLPPRPAGYTDIKLIDIAPQLSDLALPQFVQQRDLPEQLGEFPVALLDVSVKAGTYVRSLARDLGAMLNTGAHLAGLFRYEASQANIEHGVAVEDLATTKSLSAYEVLQLPKHTISDDLVGPIRLGQRPKLVVDSLTALFTESRELIALVEPHPDNPKRVKFVRVFPAESA